MAAFDGACLQALIVDVSSSKTRPRFSYGAGEFASVQALAVLCVGDHSAGGVVHASTKTPTARDGYCMTEATVGFDWFDKVHLIPRTPFAFGVIVGQTTDTFEVFSAWRTSINYTTYLNNISAGVSTPDLPTPTVALDPFTSFTDPGTSVRLSYQPVEIIVAKDGPPLFDDTIDLTFSTGEVIMLRVSGQRVSIIPILYEENVEELWRFVSDTIQNTDGTEQVISLTENPIQSLAVTYKLDGTERQLMQSILHGTQGTQMALPIWVEMIKNTATVSAAATSATVDATADVDFRVGGLAIIYDSPEAFDVVKISAIGANSITFATTPTINSYTPGATIAPARLGYVINNPTAQKSQVNLETTNLVFRVIDNDVGMFAADASGFNTSAFDGKVLLDDCNVMGNSVSSTYDRRIHVIDNDVGTISIDTDWASNQRLSTKGFSMRSRAEILNVKKLLLALQGQQKSFRLPTFSDDLTVVLNISAATSTIDVSNVGLTKFSNDGGVGVEPKRVFRITFTDGTALEREIQSSVENSTTVERLTLNTTWPDPRTIAEVSRIEFLELTRFSTDNYKFQYDRIGRARLSVPTKTLLNP